MTTSKLTQAHIPCPNTSTCGSSDAYSTYDDGHGFCYSCNTYFPPPNSTSSDRLFTYEYLPRRGLTKETLMFFDTKTKINEAGKPVAVGYRYPNGNYKTRTLDKKGFYTEKDRPLEGLFGRDRFAAGSHKYVTITEGEDDAESLYQVLRSPVVSVQSASTAGRDCTCDRSWLNSFERIYLAFDNDGPGRDAARVVAKLFDFNKVFQVKFSNRKDANEYLRHNEADELRNVWENSRKYIPEEIIHSLDDFKEILKNPPKNGVSYPFPTLTEMTYGIRTGETVLLKAKEKVGKTELMHAIEFQLLKETNDAVGAIFLEEPKQRHLQALAGLHLRKPVHLPDCNCTADQIYSAVKTVVGTDGRLHLYSHFGCDDPDVLLDTVRFLVSACGCKYILFDHISMAVSGLSGENDERRALEYLATRLEMMVKELNFALIMVSHVNDQGQTRGSHYLTKVADITIDAARNLMHPDEKERRTIHLSIPYNRFCYKTGPAGNIVFDPVTNTLTEEISNGDEGTRDGGGENGTDHGSDGTSEVRSCESPSCVPDQGFPPWAKRDDSGSLVKGNAGRG